MSKTKKSISAGAKTATRRTRKPLTAEQRKRKNLKDRERRRRQKEAARKANGVASCGNGKLCHSETSGISCAGCPSGSKCRGSGKSAVSVRQAKSECRTAAPRTFADFARAILSVLSDTEVGGDAFPLFPTVSSRPGIERRTLSFPGGRIDITVVSEAVLSAADEERLVRERIASQIADIVARQRDAE